MKIYKPTPVDVLRISITKSDEQTEYLTISECEQDEFIEFVKLLLKDKVNPFPVGDKTTVNVREAKGAENGKSKSVKFYGLSPSEVKEIIEKELKYEE